MKNKSIFEPKSADSSEGKSLKSVKIGKQIWALENLNVSKFRNGDPIPEIQSDDEWEKAGEERKPAWCYYDNDPSYGEIYGKLYNWFAINDSRGLAPKGWDIPTDEEWTILIDNLSGESMAGIVLKAYSGWEPLNEVNALGGEDSTSTNDSGFTALPGGKRNEFSFNGIGSDGVWWSSTEIDTISACNRNMYAYYSVVDNFEGNKSYGFSVRCIKDKKCDG